MSELAYFRKILRKRERETECKTQNAALVAKKRKKGKRESFVLSWRDGPLTKRKEKRGKRKDAFASSSSTKKDKKVCPPPPSSLASTSSSSSSSTFYSSPVYYSPRSSLAFEASSRSLSSLSFTYRARVFLFSLSLAEKKKKPSSGRRETKLEMKRRRSSRDAHTLFFLCPRGGATICIKTREEE